MQTSLVTNMYTTIYSSSDYVQHITRTEPRYVCFHTSCCLILHCKSRFRRTCFSQLQTIKQLCGAIRLQRALASPADFPCLSSFPSSHLYQGSFTSRFCYTNAVLPAFQDTVPCASTVSMFLEISRPDGVQNLQFNEP